MIVLLILVLLSIRLLEIKLSLYIFSIEESSNSTHIELPWPVNNVYLMMISTACFPVVLQLDLQI